ncbi:MAG: AbrB/MazE/SpoVT family DNA-binding domain-containing protein [Deltaproteobacteria bacterium]|nr:MAG: AbrB/MazE/SpoVT family DNA-binding domain-containing protein [Deltaproteobacteria bacterium]
MTAVKKWGNSLAVRIPAQLAQQLNLTENTPVEYAVVDGRLVISRITQQGTYSLDQLLDRVTKENIHSEVDTGPAVGREIF